MNAYEWGLLVSLSIIGGIALWEDVTGFRFWYE